MPEVNHGYFLRPRCPKASKVSKPRASKKNKILPLWLSFLFAILFTSFLFCVVAANECSKEKERAIERHDDDGAISSLLDEIAPFTVSLVEKQQNVKADIVSPRDKFWPLAHRTPGRYQYRVLSELDVYGKPYGDGPGHDPNHWHMRRVFVEHMPHPLLDGSPTTKKEDEHDRNQLKLALRDLWAADFGIKPDTDGMVARFSIWYCQSTIVNEVLHGSYDFQPEERIKFCISNHFCV
jgi:hypothetical protein